MSKFQISNSTKEDLPMIDWLFNEAIKLKAQKNYKVWEKVDMKRIEKEIVNQLHYKVSNGTDIIAIFSIQLSDFYIWKEKDLNDALYLHRIVVHPNFKGQKIFALILDWANKFAQKNKLRYIRMDTWAENKKLIAYYTSFGFKIVKEQKTANTPELPLQNRNLILSLLEMEVC